VRQAGRRLSIGRRKWALMFFLLQEGCRAVPPRPCLGSIVVHDIWCTAVTPFIKDCLTEAVLIPLMHHAAAVPLDTKIMIT
jgi:hypothetical protein